MAKLFKFAKPKRRKKSKPIRLLKEIKSIRKQLVTKKKKKKGKQDVIKEYYQMTQYK